MIEYDKKTFVFLCIFFTIALAIMSFMTWKYVSNVSKAPVFACTIGKAVTQQQIDRANQAFGWPINCTTIETLGCPEGYNISPLGSITYSDRK